MKTKLLLFAGLLMMSFLWSGLAYSQTINTTIGSVTACPGSTNVLVPVTVENINNVYSISYTLFFSKTQLTYTGYTSGTAIATSGGSLLVNAPPPGANPLAKIIVSWYSLNPLPAVAIGDPLITFKFTVTGGSSPITWDLASQAACEYSDLDGFVYPATWVNGGITATLPNATFTSTPSVCAGAAADLTVDFTSGTAPFTLVYNDGVNPDVTVTTSDDPYVISETISATTTWTIVSIATTSCSNLSPNLNTTTTLSDGPMAFNVTGGGSVCAGGLAAAIGLDGSETGTTYELFLDGVTTGQTFPGTNAAIDFGGFTVAGTYTVVGTSACGTTDMTGNAVVVTTSGPVVTLDAFASVCIYSPMFELTGGLPLGGIYSGNGVVNGMFNPDLAGVGTHTITYTVGEGGCSGFATQDITVEESPVVTLESYTPVCMGSAAFALSGFPEGGTFEGSGVTGNIFDPSLAGEGTWTITYTYSTPEGALCSASATTEITVNALPVIIFEPLGNICENGAPIEQLQAFPLGGVFSGEGVEGSTFFPFIAGVGTFPITYTYTDGNGCTAAVSQDITVNPQPIVTFDVLGPFCSNASPVNLSSFGTPSGGTFAGTAVYAAEEQQFWPEIAGAGTFTLTYTYANEFGCSDFATQDVVVVDGPTGSMSNDTAICSGNSVLISVTLNGGDAPYQFSFSDGVAVETITTDGYWELLVTPGESITYTVQNITGANGCTSAASLSTSVTVIPLPEITFLPESPLCASQGPVLLVATPEGGEFSGVGVTGNYFEPATVGAGIYPVSYSYTNEFGCSTSASFDITVIPSPEILSNPADVITAEGTTASFSVTTANETSVQWQVSVDGGMAWSDIVDNTIYSGTNTNQLVISMVNVSMNGYLYQAVASGLCDPAAVSAYASLSIPSSIVTIAGTVSSCASNTILVPVSVENLVDVAAMSLTLDYGTDLTFGGYQDLNPQIDEGFLFVNALNGHVKISYFNVVPLNIGNGLLMNLIFSATTGTSSLVWDVVTPGNCEYQNLDFVVLASQFVDGSVTISASPEIIFDNVGPLCLDAAPVELTASPAGGTFSGEGVSDGMFYPGIAGAGTWTITYTYTYGTDCSASATQEVTVLALPEVTLEAIGPFCMSAEAVQLNGSPAGGVYAGDGVDNGMFNPALAGPGMHIITYTFTDVNGCTGSTASITVEVFELPMVSFDPLLSVCSSSSPVTLVGMPEGGVFTGIGVSGNTFDPAVSGTGTFTLTYTYTDLNGCTGSASQEITVGESPSITFDPIANVCANGSPVELTAMPAGGTFSGTGVMDGMFYPEVAGIGVWTITYTVSLGADCSSSASQDITVMALPVVTLEPVGPFCQDAASVSLSGSPAGGAYAGTGVEGGMFNPALAGPGMHTVSYYYTDENGCSGNPAMITVEVFELPLISFGPLSALCSTSSAITLVAMPEGGVFTGTGVDGNTFDPAVSGIGTFTVTYTYTDMNGCTNSASQDITVGESPAITFAPLANVCISSGAVELVALPAGGTFSGTGVVDGMFYPEVAGTGTWTITYTYTLGTDCSGSASQDITVMALPVVSVEPVAPLCLAAEAVMLVGSPTGGSFSGPGVEADYFNPAVSGPGTFTVTYTYSDVDGCMNTATTDITVYEAPVVSVSASSYSVCSDAAAVELTGSPAGGTFSGTGVVGNFFYPETGIGEWTIEYSYTNESGCSAAASLVISVNALPVVSIDPVSPVCTTTEPFMLVGQPAGGVFSGDGVSGGYFYPAMVGEGTYEISYTYTNEFGCTASALSTISVVGIAAITFDPIPAVCASASAFQLMASPSGGVFSGTGVTGDMFDPALSGTGTFTVTYTYSNGPGCLSSATQDVTVNALPSAILSGGGTVCAGTSATIQIDFLTGTPPFFVTFAGGFELQTNDYSTVITYTPEVSTTYTMVSVVDANGCLVETNQSVSIIVNPAPASFNVTGGGAYCSEGMGVSVGLDGSESGVTYTLYLNGESTTSTTTGNGSAISFSNVMAAGTYTVSATTENGCSAMMSGDASVSISAGLTVSAGSDVTIPIGSSTSLTASVTGGTGPFTYFWSPATGLNSTSLETVIASPGVTTTYSVMVMDALNCMGMDEVVVFVLAPQNNLSGTITYPNAQGSPLANVVVTLSDPAGIEADQVTVTDAAGHYAFNDLALTTYNLHASSTHVWGGGNAIDGLIMLRHFVGLQFLTGLKLEAGDVTGNHMINAHDGLNTVKRFVGLLPNFAPVGDWVFDHPSVVIDGLSNKVVDFNGLCTGDVNADYNVGAKAASTVAVSEEGTVFAANGIVIVPVVAQESMNIGSVSMIVKIPAQATVNSVNMNGDNKNLVYSVVGNELRIGWFSLESMNINAGDNLLTITLAITTTLDGQSVEVDGSSILSDNIANVINMAKLSVPKISSATVELSFNSFPNPVNANATFTYTLPESGKVMVELFNAIGERVSVITNEFQDAGFHSMSYDAASLSQGIYLARLTVNGSTVNKMISINR